MTPIIGSDLFHQLSQGSHDRLAELQSASELSSQVFQLSVLAKDNDGYQTMLKLVSSGYLSKDDVTVPVLQDSDFEAARKSVVVIQSLSQK